MSSQSVAFVQEKQEKTAALTGAPTAPAAPLEQIPPPQEAPTLTTLKELVNFLYDHRESILASALTFDVKEVSFVEGNFVYEALATAPKNLSLLLQSKLAELTKKQWIIEQTEVKGGQTLQEKNNFEKKILQEEAKNHPVVQQFQSTFKKSTLKV